MEVVIDSSVLVRILYANDHRHQQAVQLAQRLANDGYTSVYFDCVIAETLSVIVRRREERKDSLSVSRLFEQFHQKIPRQNITWMSAEISNLYPKILHLMQTSHGSLNFNDALIALSCQTREITSIASFDQDFDQIPWLTRLT